MTICELKTWNDVERSGSGVAPCEARIATLLRAHSAPATSREVAWSKLAAYLRTHATYAGAFGDATQMGSLTSVAPSWVNEDFGSHVVYLNSEWVAIAESAKADLTVKEVKIIVKGVDERLRNHQFALLDSELASLRVRSMYPDAICAVVRTTAIAKHRLANWARLLELALKRLGDDFPTSRALEGIDVAETKRSIPTKRPFRVRNPQDSRRRKALWNPVR
jgi:hypothetical protein